MSEKPEIIIVDDDSNIRKTLADILTTRGYNTMVFEDGQSAIEFVTKTPPAIALIDLRLGNMSGLDLIQQIKEQNPETECIVITGYASQDSAIEAINLGAFNFILKPYDIDHLIITIRRAIEKQQSTKTLRMSEMRLKNAQTVAKIGHFSLDIGTKKWACSSVVDDIFGIDEQYSKDISDWFHLIHPDDREAMQLYLENDVLEQGNKFDKEYRIINQKTGEELWVHGIGELEIEAGSPKTMFGTTQDITERKHAEKALRDSEERFRSLTETTSDWIWEVDQNGVYTYASPKITDLLGYTPDEVLGKSPFDLMPPEEANRVSNEINEILEARKAFKNFENITLNKDRELVIVESSGIPVFDEDKNLIGYRGIDRDVTERVRSEAAMRESEEKFRTLAEKSPNMIFINLKGRIEYANEACEQMTGYSRAEFYKDNFDFLNLIAPESREHVRENFQRHMNGSEVPVYEYKLLTKNNDHLDVIITTRLIPYEGEMGILGIITDITEQKKTEQSLRENQALLESIFRAAPTSIGLVSERVLLQVNETLCELLGYEADELIGQDARILYPTEADYEYVGTEKYRLIQEHGTGTVESRWQTKDGQIIDVLMSSTPIDPNNLAVGVTFTALDITERKRAEKELINRAQQLTTLNTIGHRVNMELSPHQVGEAALEEIFNAINPDLILFFLQDGEDLIPSGKMTNEDRFQHHESPVHKVGECLCGLTADSGEPIVSLNIQNDPRCIWNECKQAGIVSFAAFPLKSGRENLGVIGIASLEERDFNIESTFLETMINEISIGLKNATLFEQAQQEIAERIRAEEQTKRQIRRLAALRQIDTTINASMELDVTLNVILEQTLSQLEVDAAAVLLLNPFTQFLEYAFGQGFHTDAIKSARIQIGKGLAGRVALSRKPVIHGNLAAKDIQFIKKEKYAAESFAAYCGIPLIAKGQVQGVLEIFHRKTLSVEPDWINFLETLGGQAAIAIDNAQLFEDLQRSNMELKLAYNSTLEGWARALELRHYETAGHSDRVTELTLKLAQAMGIHNEDLVHVYRGALLHDIGKMGIPDEILFKPEKLDETEWVTMKKHPVYAYEMLSSIEFLRPALDIPYCHHELWDGSGYPRGLAGQTIPLAARVFSVVDEWDALTSDRPYRDAWSVEETIQYIQEKAGQRFDPQVVQEFLKIIQNE